MARILDRYLARAGALTIRARLQELVARLGQETVASVVVLADGDGQSAAHWYRMGEVDVHGIAALVAGSMVARRALSAAIGGSAEQSTVVQEYDDQIVLLMRVDADLVLLAVLEEPGRLGMARLALRRAGQQIAALRAAPPSGQSLALGGI